MLAEARHDVYLTLLKFNEEWHQGITEEAKPNNDPSNAAKKFKINHENSVFQSTNVPPTLLWQANKVWLDDYNKKNLMKPKCNVQDMVQAWTKGKYFSLTQNELLGWIIIFKKLYSLEDPESMNRREKILYQLVKICFE